MVNTRPPTDKMQQVVSVETQALVRQAAHVLAIQVTIDPTDFVARLLFDNANWALCSAGGLRIDKMKFHGWAASSSDWNCRASPPWTKKLLGSWPSGSETRRAVMPCSQRRRDRHCAACWPLSLPSASKAR